MDVLTIDQLLSHLDAYLGRRYAANSRRAFLRQSRAFLEAMTAEKLTPPFRKSDILGYVDTLIGRGMNPKSIHTTISGVHALFDAMEWVWPVTRRDLHLGLDSQTIAVAMPGQDLEALIVAAKRLPFPAPQIVALASVYGFRTHEVAEIISAGMDGDHVVGFVKMGKQRTHAMPPELSGILTFPKPAPITKPQVQRMFARLMRDHVRKAITGEGCHAIRRTVRTALTEAGLHPYLVHRFMGMASLGQVMVTEGHDQEIDYRYFKPEDVDAKVYARHPFLPLWR